MRDAYGALSDVMFSTVVVGGGSGGRRRLLASPSDMGLEGGRRLLMQSSFDWPGAAALLDDELLAGNYDELNNMASALILEVDSQYAGMNLTAAESLAQKDVFFTKLESAAVIVNDAGSMSEGYMCTSLNLASTISSTAEHLSTALVERMLDHVTILVSDEHSSVRPPPTKPHAINQSAWTPLETTPPPPPLSKPPPPPLEGTTTTTPLEITTPLDPSPTPFWIPLVVGRVLSGVTKLLRSIGGKFGGGGREGMRVHAGAGIPDVGVT